MSGSFDLTIETFYESTSNTIYWRKIYIHMHGYTYFAVEMVFFNRIRGHCAWKGVFSVRITRSCFFQLMTSDAVDEGASNIST